MTNCPTWNPPNEGEGFSHRIHRPKKNRNGNFILGNKIFGKKLKSKKAILEETQEEELEKEIKEILK